MSGCTSIGLPAPHGRRLSALVAGGAAALLLAACGGGQRQDASEPSGNFPVQITAQSFPTAQTLSEHTHMVIAVRNAGNKTIPDIAVTVCPVTCHYPAPTGEGTSSAVFDSNQGENSLDDPTPPPWVVDTPPDPYSCGSNCPDSGASSDFDASGGAGGAATAAPDTWALGQLKPGATATFTWAVTAVSAGRHVVAWQVAAGLYGKAKAVLAGGGGKPAGQFDVTVSSAPAQSYVTGSGQIVTTP